MVFKYIKNLGIRGRYIISAILIAFASLLGSLPGSLPVHAAIGSVTQYSIADQSSDRFPGYLTVGPDNNIWYTDDGYNSRIHKVTTLGNVTEYYPTLQTGKYMKGITKGSDNNLWYAEQTKTGSIGRIVKMSTAGVLLNTYNVPSGYSPICMALGPDGAIWFTEGRSASNVVGKIDTLGQITEYSVPLGSSGTPNIDCITAGPDGNMWFTVTSTSLTKNAIGKITTSGVSTIYHLSTYPTGITAGPDGNMWFSEGTANKIAKITTSGTITEYSLASGTGPGEIVLGSDNALWFIEGAQGKIGRISTAGITTDYAIPNTLPGSLNHLVAGPDGAVWFTNRDTDTVNRISTELISQTISFTSTAPIEAIVDGPVYTPTSTATSGLPVVITIDPTSSSVCSINGSGEVSFQGAGQCILNANQAGNVDYKPASQVQQSFTVLPVDADSSVSLDCPTTANLNDTITCSITVTNTGPALAKDIVLSALFPSSFTNASISGGATLSGQYITWSSSSLPSQNSATFTLNAIASVKGKAKISAALLQTSPDPTISNNIVETTILIN